MPQIILGEEKESRHTYFNELTEELELREVGRKEGEKYKHGEQLIKGYDFLSHKGRKEKEFERIERELKSEEKRFIVRY